MEIDVAKLEHRLTVGEQQIKVNTDRLDELEKRQDNLEDLTSTVKVLADREERVENDVTEIKSDVKNILSKPGKRWDNLVGQVISILVAAVIGFIIAKLGL